MSTHHDLKVTSKVSLQTQQILKQYAHSRLILGRNRSSRFCIFLIIICGHGKSCWDGIFYTIQMSLTFEGLLLKQYNILLSVFAFGDNDGNLCGDMYTECRLETRLGDVVWHRVGGSGESGGTSWNWKQNIVFFWNTIPPSAVIYGHRIKLTKSTLMSSASA